MKKVMLRLTLRRFISLVLSSLLLFFVFSAIPPEIQEVPQQNTVAAIEKPKWVHTLSTWELSKLYTLRDDPNTDTTLNLTIEEATLLMQIARSEGGDTKDGQLWVMGLIANRLYDDSFPDSIFKIVSANRQFEVYRTGAYKTADVNINSHLALAELESGNNPTNGCLYFEASSNSNDSWHAQNREFVAEIAGNKFYK